MRCGSGSTQVKSSQQCSEKTEARPTRVKHEQVVAFRPIPNYYYYKKVPSALVRMEYKIVSSCSRI